MKRVGKNSIALGLVMALISLALSFSASGATTTHHVAHAEARYLAGMSAGIGALADAISNQVEGESADCSTAELEALTGDAECTKEHFNSDTLIPLGGQAALTLGAVDNYAGVSGSAAADATHPNALASSGVVGDNGFIDTDYAGPKGKVTLSLDNGALTGPISDNLADVQAQFGAVSGEATAVKDDVARRYHIASATLTAKATVLDTLNQQIADAMDGYDLLGTLSGTDQLTLSKLAAVAPGPLKPITDLLPLESLVDIDVNFPSLTDLTSAVADYSHDGVQIDAGTGTVTVDLVQLLEASGSGGINSLPAGTDLMTYALPALAEGLNTMVTNLFAAVTAEFVDKSTVTVSLLGTPPVTLDATQLGALLDPVTAGLDSVLTPAGSALTDNLTTAFDQNALAPVLQLKVNNHDLYGQELVADDVAASSPNEAKSQTALRIVLLDGDAADLRLGNAVVVPDSTAVSADDADTQAAQDQDSDADSNADANADVSAAADADADVTEDADVDAAAAADAAADANADAAADADVTAALPNTGAPNVLPLLLLALGLIGFGTAVLANEKRRMGQL